MYVYDERVVPRFRDEGPPAYRWSELTSFFLGLNFLYIVFVGDLLLSDVSIKNNRQHIVPTYFSPSTLHTALVTCTLPVLAILLPVPCLRRPSLTCATF